MNPKVDLYLLDGCGRCPFGGTTECKVHSWPEELKLLRRILLDCGLVEELKWGVPCYTYVQHNILTLAAFKQYCGVGFFKGALLMDEAQILDKPGENSQAGRLIRFTSVQQILELETVLAAYVYEAIEVEKAGLKVQYKKPSEFDIPAEFQQKLAEDPALNAAFQALTPGRQRGYLLYFSAPKQAKTREDRIQKFMPLIFQGKGLND